MNTITPQPAPPANRPNPGGLASNAPRERHYTPCELSGLLKQHGISLGADRIRERCALPPSNPLFIHTNIAFPGRHYIPESELIRLVTSRHHG